MEIVNRTIASLRELVLSMTPGARISAGLFAAVVIASGALLFQQSHRDPEELLFGGERFSPSKVVQVEAALASVGNDFRIVENQVFVPRSKKDIYIEAVDKAGALPRNFDSIMSTALEGGSFLDDHATRQLRTQAARESQLSHLISLIPWVDQASVMFTIEETRGLRSKQLASATVSVLPRPGELLDGRRISNLKQTVAGWHPSLAPERVTVTNLGDDSFGIQEDSLQSRDDAYFKFRIACEQRKRESIAKVLSHIPGVRVQVSAQLEAASEVQVSDSKSEHSRESFQEKEVFVAIAVPSDYFVHVFRRRHATAEGQPLRDPDENELRAVQAEELSKIENLVRPLLPQASVADSQRRQIHIDIVDPIADEFRVKPALASNTLDWTTPAWSILSIFAITAVGFLLLRSVVRTGKQSMPEELSAKPELMHHRTFIASIQSPRSELADFVRQNPNSTAAIFRNWIGNAS